MNFLGGWSVVAAVVVLAFEDDDDGFVVELFVEEDPKMDAEPVVELEAAEIGLLVDAVDLPQNEVLSFVGLGVSFTGLPFLEGLFDPMPAYSFVGLPGCDWNLGGLARLRGSACGVGS